MYPSFTLMIQMVQKGEANCHRRTFTGIYEKALSEDDRSAMNNGIHILVTFSTRILDTQFLAID